MQEVKKHTAYGKPVVIHVLSDGSDVEVASPKISKHWEVRSDQ